MSQSHCCAGWYYAECCYAECWFVQGTLTEGEGSVHLTLFRLLVMLKGVKYIFSIKAVELNWLV